MGDGDLRSLRKSIEGLDVSSIGSDFLSTFEKSNSELAAVVAVADLLEQLHLDGRSMRAFDSGVAVSIFRDKSTRTRFSFAFASDLLGLALSDLDEKRSQISHGETVRETATMISFLSEVIGIRDDIYLDRGHRYIRQVADAVQSSYDEGVLHQRPSVINLQCDRDHPTQSVSDLLHLVRHFGTLKALAGKKIAMSWAYSPSYGKPLSVPQGIIGLMTRFGMDVTLAHPDGYELIPDLVEQASSFAGQYSGNFSIVESMEEAFEDADVVYPKSWAPFEVMQQRTQLLEQGDQRGLDDLERHCLDRNSKHVDWECDDRKMALTKNKNALYLHCLPADISGVSCERGEVSKQVFDRYRVDTYKEAQLKPFVIAAMILLCRFENPAQLIDGFLNSDTRRLKDSVGR